jgi:DNA-binding response OmpR family regulator
MSARQFATTMQARCLKAAAELLGRAETMRILVVEDEAELAQLIIESLRRSGFEADLAPTLEDARIAIGAQSYSLALLDRRLPDGDSVHLTALDAVSDKIAGLDAGADDYLTKPFDINELLARIRANLRRSSGQDTSEPPITVAALSFDPRSREASVHGQFMILHRRELAVLDSLIRRNGRATPREILIEEVYSGEEELQSNALDALISRLRKHLNENDSGVSIYPIRGIGYMLAKSPG